jgi:hypothetical protein
MPADKATVKSTLEAAQAQLGHAAARVDAATPDQLAELHGLARAAAAFVDFNSGCGGSSRIAGHTLLEKLSG